MAAKWYYQDPSTEERAGPVKVEFVRNLIETGVVQDDTLVWTKGMVDWVSPEREREREGEDFSLSLERQTDR